MGMTNQNQMFSTDRVALKRALGMEPGDQFSQLALDEYEAAKRVWDRLGGYEMSDEMIAGLALRIADKGDPIAEKVEREKPVAKKSGSKAKPAAWSTGDEAKQETATT